MPGAKRRLGRGLEVLLPSLEPAAGDAVQDLTLEQIEPNPEQPRRRFDPASLRELADSLTEHGMLQPVIVRALGGRYQLVAGERRCRAAEMAGLTRVPAIVREYSDSEMLEIALLENLQREDLNPLEEAEAYSTLIDRFGLTQEDLARRLGRSRPAIGNALRLLTLEPQIRELVMSGALSAGHARALLAVNGGTERLTLAHKATVRGLSVRDVERQARRAARPRARVRTAAPALAEIEEDLRTALGSRVRIRRHGKRGTIEVEFIGDADLERLLELLTGRAQAQRFT